MTALRVAILRLLDLVLRRRRNARLDEEVQAHLELLAAEHQARGMSSSDARLAARRSFGPVDSMKTLHRERRGLPLVDALVQDLRVAVRLMVKERWFTAAAVATLALGIGVNNTVFAISNAAWFRGLPFDDPQRVLSLGTRDSRTPLVTGPLGYRGLSYPEYEDWRLATRAFQNLAAYTDGPVNLSDEVRAPERFAGSYVSANLFALLGHQPALGRDFRADDDARGSGPVVIIGHGVWAARFGADPAIVGKTVRVNGVPSTIVGIMPAGFKFPLNHDVWQPLARWPGLARQNREVRTLEVVGRVRDGVTRAQTEDDLERVTAHLGREYPVTNAHTIATLTSYGDRHFAPQMKILFTLLMGAVGCVLLIACANVANLLFARSATRAREIAVRASLGASRGRIVRQLLVETLCLAVVAGVLGLAISVAGLRLFSATVEQTGAPYWFRFEMDGSAFFYFAVLCVGTAALSGLTPALHVSRTELVEVLKEGGRAGAGSRRARRWTGALIVGQVAMTLVLLASAGFMLRAFFDLYRLDVGVDTSRLTTMRLELPGQEYPEAGQRLAFFDRLDERLRALPVVESAAMASVPFGGGRPRPFSVGDHPALDGSNSLRAAVVAIGSRYFETLGVSVRRGRVFKASDGEAGQEHVIVNDSFADRFLAGVDPIGRRVQLSIATSTTPSEWLTIVGVSPTVGRLPQPTIYVPLKWEPVQAVSLVVRSTAAGAALAAMLRDEVRALDDDLPLFRVETLEESLAFARWPERVFGSIFGIFAALGLALSAVGLYAVVRYLVAQRTHEVGVRMALGARAAQVTWLIVRRTIIHLAIGFGIGLPIAVGIGLALPFGSRDLATLVPVMALLLAVTLAACAVPARRAARLDPISALRHE